MYIVFVMILWFYYKMLYRCAYVRIRALYKDYHYYYGYHSMKLELWSQLTIRLLLFQTDISTDYFYILK